jgi:hypothetical protein
MFGVSRMAEDPARQRHDKLFKLGFGELSRAAAFLCAHVPPKLARAIEASLDDAIGDEELLREAARGFELVLRYILASDVTSATFRRKIHSVRTSVKCSNAMTLAQQIHADRKAEGLLAARQAAVVKALEVRYGGVPEGLIGAVYAIRHGEKLRDLHRHAIRCADREAFSQNLWALR